MPRPPSIPIDLSKLEFHSLSTLAASHNTAKTNAEDPNKKTTTAPTPIGGPKPASANKTQKKQIIETDKYQVSC